MNFEKQLCDFRFHNNSQIGLLSNNNRFFTYGVFFQALTVESSKLISDAVSTLPSVPGLCTPEASVNVLPSVLYLLTCTLREVALIKDSSSQKTVSATLQALKQLTTSPFTHNPNCSRDWLDLLQRFAVCFYFYE